MLQMSAVETGQMSSVETGQMSAVETGQMTAAETSVLSQQKTVKKHRVFVFELATRCFVRERRRSVSPSIDFYNNFSPP